MGLAWLMPYKTDYKKMSEDIYEAHKQINGQSKNKTTFSVGPNENGGATVVFVTTNGNTTTVSMGAQDAELLADLLLLVLQKT